MWLCGYECINGILCLFKWSITQISMLGHSVLHGTGFNRTKDIDKAGVPWVLTETQSSKIPEAEFGLAGAGLEVLCPQGILPAIGFGSIQNLGSIYHRLLSAI